MSSNLCGIKTPFTVQTVSLTWMALKHTTVQQDLLAVIQLHDMFTTRHRTGSAMESDIHGTNLTRAQTGEFDFCHRKT
jgi:hypothetical protein